MAAATSCWQSGRDFAAVIGDMDLLRSADALRGRGVALHAIGEQDTTDLEKCLYSVEAPLFLGLGFLGGRIDHALAAVGVLARQPDKRLVLVGDEDLCLLCPPDFTFAAPAGTRVSLYAMRAVTGRVSDGLRWPIAGLDFAPDGRNGISNEATGGLVRIGFDAPGAILILPVALLGQVVDRIAAA